MSRPTKGQRRRNKAANRRAIRKREWASIPQEWRDAWEPTPAAPAWRYLGSSSGGLNFGNLRSTGPARIFLPS